MASAPSADPQAPANPRDGAPPPPNGHGSSELSSGTSPAAGGEASGLVSTGAEGIPAGAGGSEPSAPTSAAAGSDASLARTKPSASPRRWLAPLLGLAALAGGGAYLVAHWGLAETDNAQLQGHLTEISSRVNGTISRVLVEDNQEVKVGQPLLQLDDRDARARLFRARADLEQVTREAQAMVVQAGASVSTARAAEGMAVADQQSASSELARSAADAQRLVGLAQQGGVSRQEAERAVTTYRKAQADFTHSQATRQTAQARIQDVRVDRQKAAAAQAKVLQAQAAFAEA